MGERARVFLSLMGPDGLFCDVRYSMKQQATPESIDELFRLTLVGDYDNEDDEGGPWEAVSKLQAIGTREVFDHAAAWARNNKPAKRRRGIDILAQLGKSETQPQVTFAAETYAIVVETLPGGVWTPGESGCGAAGTAVPEERGPGCAFCSVLCAELLCR